MKELTVKQAQALRWLAQDGAVYHTKWHDPHAQDAGHPYLNGDYDRDAGKVPGSTLTALAKAGLIAEEHYRGSGWSRYNHTWRITDAGRQALADYVAPEPVAPQLTRLWQVEQDYRGDGHYFATWIDCRQTAKGWIVVASEDGYSIGTRYEPREVYATPEAALEARAHWFEHQIAHHEAELAQAKERLAKVMQAWIKLIPAAEVEHDQNT